VVKNVLPLGLYRSQTQDSLLPYVFTNCPKETILKEKDKVFVLAAREPEPEPELEPELELEHESGDQEPGSEHEKD